MFKTVSGFLLVAGALAAGATLMDQETSEAEAPARPGAERVSAMDTSRQALTAITADRSGHFIASALVNGVHVEMVADTGASAVVLTQDDAQRAGLDVADLSFDVRMQTANGISLGAAVTLDEVEVGQVRVRDVRALVARRDALATSLLGMTFIGALSRFELKGSQLVLIQ